MSDDELKTCRKVATKNGEPTQRFSALQQQLLCAAINFFHRHIRSDQDVLQRMEGNKMFRLFFEVQYHNKPDLNRIFPESVQDCSLLHVCSFILSILHQGIFSVSAFIVSVIYLSRFKEMTHITLHACTWRPLFLTSLLIADKMWEDKPVRNSSLAKLFPVLDNIELNKMESEFILAIRFNVIVKPDLFCSFCEKLLAESVQQEIAHCVANSEYAATLQAEQDPDGNPVAKPAAGKTEGSHHPIADVALVGGSYHPAYQPAPPHISSQGGAQAHVLQCPQAQGLHGQLQGQGTDQRAESGPPLPCKAGFPWLNQATAVGTSVVTGAPHKVHDNLVTRSLSAGPSAGLRRTVGGSQPGSGSDLQQPPAHFRMGRAPSTGRGNSGVLSPCVPAPPFDPTGKRLAQQPGRSMLLHQLNCNETAMPNPIGAAGDTADQGGRAASGQRTPGFTYSGPGPHMRRSLPAKTSNTAFMPLARAPGSNSMIGPPALGIGAHGSHATSSHASHDSSGVMPAPGSSSNLAAASRGIQQSPRSPHGPPQVAWQAQQQAQHHAQQQQAAHQAAQQRAQSQQRSHSPLGHAHPWAGTPPVPKPNASQAAPGGLPMAGYPQACVPGVPNPHSGIPNQHARSSSATRVASISARQTSHGDSASVHPAARQVQAGMARQTMSAAFGSSSPLPSSGAFSSGAGSVPTPPHVRHPSPLPFSAHPQQPVAGGAMPVGMSRGVGPSPRNAASLGMAAPGSPAGHMGMGAQDPFGCGSAADRGRSPPAPRGGVPVGHPMVRAPRAHTPSSIINGIAQGTHTTVMQQRGSLGAPSMAFPRAGLA